MVFREPRIKPGRHCPDRLLSGVLQIPYLVLMGKCNSPCQRLQRKGKKNPNGPSFFTLGPNVPSPKRNISTVNQVSAGGVAFRRQGNEVHVALISVGETRRWQLPKGTVEENETHESAAVREVREETGIQTEVIRLIERIEYWFFTSSAKARTRHHKFVYFYLLRGLAGDIRNHDREVNESRWVEITTALSMLKFPNERKVLARAYKMIKRLPEAPSETPRAI